MKRCVIECVCAIALATALLFTAGCAQARPGAPLGVQSPKLPSPASSRMIVIVMENAEYSEVLGNRAAPYINALASRYGLATHSFAIGHPSLPNYLALTSVLSH